MFRAPLPLLLATVVVAFLAVNVSGQYSGSTVRVFPGFLTKVATAGLPSYVSHMASTFSMTLPVQTLPSLPYCTFTPTNDVTLKTYSINSVSVSSLLTNLLFTFFGVSAETQPVNFDVKCLLNTPAGQISMAVSGSVTISITNADLSGTMPVSLSALAKVPVTRAFTATTGFSTISTIAYVYTVDNKFPFDGNVEEHLATAVRMGVTQAIASAMVTSSTAVLGADLTSAFGIFDATCDVTSSNSTSTAPRAVDFNVAPVCASIHVASPVLPAADITLTAPSTNSSVQLPEGEGCVASKCWPYATLGNGWTLVFKDCQFCVVNGGADVAQVATLVVVLP